MYMYYDYRLTGGPGSNPGDSEVSRTRPHRPWVIPNLLYSGWWVSFAGVKMSERGDDHPPTSSAEVEERVALYIYSLSGPSPTALQWILRFMYTHLCYNLVLCAKEIYPKYKNI